MFVAIIVLGAMIKQHNINYSDFFLLWLMPSTWKFVSHQQEVAVLSISDNQPKKLELQLLSWSMFWHLLLLGLYFYRMVSFIIHFKFKNTQKCSRQLPFFALRFFYIVPMHIGFSCLSKPQVL